MLRDMTQFTGEYSVYVSAFPDLHLSLQPVPEHDTWFRGVPVLAGFLATSAGGAVVASAVGAAGSGLSIPHLAHRIGMHFSLS